MNESFDDLAKGLTDEKRAEFFQTLHEAGIDPRDSVLARLLRALQLYKAYYEKIPADIQKAVADIERLKDGIDNSAEDAMQSVSAGEQILDQVIKVASKVEASLSQLQVHIDDVVHKSSKAITQKMTETLRTATAKAIPIEELAAAGSTFKDAVATSEQATASLYRNIKGIRQAHLFTYVMGTCSLVIVFWVFLHLRYERMTDENRTTVIEQVKDNQAVLNELAIRQRRMELVPDSKNPKRKLLVIDDAEGWTTKNKQGVIEFKE